MTITNLLLFGLTTSFIVFGVSYFLTYFSKILALKFKVLDNPESAKNRKFQKTPIPLLGGMGFVLTSILSLSFFHFAIKLNLWGFQSISINLENFEIVWIIVSILILAFGGLIDDAIDSPKILTGVFVATAILATSVFGNVRIETLSYPFDTLFPDNFWFSILATFIWFGLCISATKFLDGHDGLVATVGIIALMAIAQVSIFDNVNQPFVFLLAISFAVSIFAFLFFNFPDAKLYMGEGGSEIVGYMIALLSTISGAKIATSSAVIGWFILDIILVIVLRKIRKKPLLEGDRLHWHFRLIDLGFGKIKVLAVTAIFVLISSHIGLILPTGIKVYLIIAQFLIILLLLGLIFILSEKKVRP